MATHLFFEVGDGGYPEALIRKGKESGPEFDKRADEMLSLIQNDVRLFIPRSEQCPGEGKGGITKSAILRRLLPFGGEVYADENRAYWFKWFEDGRGKVKVKKAKALHFCMGGKHIFVKSVKGTKGRDSMGKGHKQAEPKVQRKFEEMGKWLSELD